MMSSNHLILCCPFSSRCQSFPASGSFLMSHLFSSHGQSIGASTSALVLPMKIQCLFPLALIGLISLQSKGLSSVLSGITVQKWILKKQVLTFWKFHHALFKEVKFLETYSWWFVSANRKVSYYWLLEIVYCRSGKIYYIGNILYMYTRILTTAIFWNMMYCHFNTSNIFIVL